MQIAQKLAGYSLGQADILRKAMGKKKKEVLDQQFKGFRQGMVDNGYSEESIKALWDVVVPFSAYAFNKAHSAAYGLVSYWTAFLKAELPDGVHGCPADLDEGQQGSSSPVPGGVPTHGHHGPAPGRERVDG